MQKLGVLDIDKANGMVEVSKHAGWWWAFQSAAIITDRPRLLTQDAQHRLHGESEMAIRYRDGFGVYAWHGVRVPALVIERPQDITVSIIEKEENQEIRRVMIERYGAARYIVDSGAALVHKDDYGVLYRKARTGDTDLVMVKVVNSTPEPDGSFKDYFLRVPPEMKTAREAVAWTFGKNEVEYMPQEQS